MASTEISNNRHRVDWIDFIKGIAITLVVYGHVMQGTVAAGLMTSSRFFQASDVFIYSFHMPAFFIVGGLLLKNLWDDPLIKHIADKARTIAWPYVVWFLIGTISAICFARFYNHVSTNPLKSLLCLAWNPGGFWFLHAFFFVHVLVAVLRRLPPTMLLAVSIISFFVAQYCPNEALHNILYYFPFMVIGLLGSRNLVGIDAFVRRWGVVLLVPVLTIQLVGAIFLPNSLWPLKLILGISGTAGIAFLAPCVSATFLYPILCRIGAASLGVFLLHPYFQGISRTILLKLLGIHSPVVLVALETFFGVIIPAIIFEMAMRTQWRLLFTLKGYSLPRGQKQPS
jgi:fucose 4-O-acetylase-like acetyltransferase